MATRIVGKGDDAYEETLKRFSGVPAALYDRMLREAGERGAKVGDVVGELLAEYMEAARQGVIRPEVLPRARTGTKSGGFWVRTDIAKEFEGFVADLPRGSQSEVLSAALRWRFGETVSSYNPIKI